MGDGRWLPPGEEPTAGRGHEGKASEDEDEVEDRDVAHPFAQLTAEKGNRGQVADAGTEQGAEQAEGPGGGAGDVATGGARRGCGRWYACQGLL